MDQLKSEWLLLLYEIYLFLNKRIIDFIRFALEIIKIYLIVFNTYQWNLDILNLIYD